jgi:hypothetical protein
MESKNIKILAIGNSFSVDSMEYLYQILKDGNYDNVILGNLYIGGCCLETHYHNIINHNKDYIYYLNKTGTWEEYPFFSILDALTSENWDIITMQQCSGKSGLSNTFQPYVNELIDYVRKYNKEAKLFWNMTWAYHFYSTHEEFINYEFNQIIMYQAIINTVNEMIITNKSFEGIIPVGTAIQNVRTFVNDDLITRDGFHLSDLGRFIASLTWFKTLTRLDLNKINYHPEFIKTDLFNNIKKAVDAAYNNPFEITNL